MDDDEVSRLSEDLTESILTLGTADLIPCRLSLTPASSPDRLLSAVR